MSASVGAGHDGAAAELANRLRARGCTVACHDGLALLPRPFGLALRRSYLAALRWTPRAWAPLLAQSSRPGATTTLVHAVVDRLAYRVLSVTADCDVVVSTYPLVSQALGRLRSRGLLAAPVVTYLTDPWVHPMWLHPGVDHVIGRRDLVNQQAVALGAGVHWCQPVVSTAFRSPVPPGRVDAVRRRFAVPAGRAAVAVTAGSEGAGDIVSTVRDLSASGGFPVALCARNAGLRRRLERLGAGVALGWTDEVPAVLAGCDAVLQNAGGLACTEALAAGRPVASYRVLPGHGKLNAAVLHDAGVVPWLRYPGQLAGWLSGIETGAATSAGLQGRVDPADVILGCAYDASLQCRPASAS